MPGWGVGSGGEGRLLLRSLRLLDSSRQTRGLDKESNSFLAWLYLFIIVIVRVNGPAYSRRPSTQIKRCMLQFPTYVLTFSNKTEQKRRNKCRDSDPRTPPLETRVDVPVQTPTVMKQTRVRIVPHLSRGVRSWSSLGIEILNRLSPTTLERPLFPPWILV